MPDEPHLTQELIEALSYACECQSMRRITEGWRRIMALPRRWTIDHIEQIAVDSLNLEDDWEFRRLLEVAQALDTTLLQRLVERGRLSGNPDVREAAHDFSG